MYLMKGISLRSLVSPMGAAVTASLTALPKWAPNAPGYDCAKVSRSTQRLKRFMSTFAQARGSTRRALPFAAHRM